MQAYEGTEHKNLQAISEISEKFNLFDSRRVGIYSLLEIFLRDRLLSKRGIVAPVNLTLENTSSINWRKKKFIC